MSKIDEAKKLWLNACCPQYKYQANSIFIPPFKINMMMASIMIKQIVQAWGGA